MKKFILALIAVLAMFTASAYAEGVTHSFENTTDGLSIVTNTLATGGNATYTEGFVGKGLALNASYGLRLGSVNGEYTVAAMVRYTSLGDAKNIFFKNMGSSTAQNWVGIVQDQGKPKLWIHNGSDHKWEGIITSSESVLNRWAYITYTESNAAAALYVDGELIGSGSVTPGKGDIYAGATFWAADAAEGVMDELFFDNSRAITADEVKNMYTELALKNVKIPAKTITDLDLPTTIGNAEVRWTSSDESVITNDGKVTRGDKNATITLSLYKGDELLGTFEVTVLKLATEVTNDDVVLSYVFDDGTEGVIEDASGNGNHGVIYGGMTGTHFDGVDDYVDMPDGILANLNEFTIVMRLKSEISKTHQFTFNFGIGNSEYFFLNTSRPTTNTLRLALTQNGSGAESDVASLPGIRDGEYAALAITVNGSQAAIYQNGIPVAAGDLGASPSVLGNTTDNWLAKSPYSGDAYFKGDIYEFTIYPRVLNPKEIEDLHYQAPEEKSYISDFDYGESELTVYLNRFCMVSAVFFDNNGRIVYSSTAKASGDDLKAVFTLPEGVNIANVELAAYDADRGIIRDRAAIATYKGVAAYGTDGNNIKITNTTAENLDVMVMAASYKEGSLGSLNTITVNVPAGSYKIVQTPAKDGERLLVWYSLKSMRPVTEQQ